MFNDTILDILESVWPMLFIIVTIVVSLRVTFLIINKTKFILYKELFMLLFIMYVICLFYVVTFQDVSWSSSNFIPFREMFRYEFGTRLFLKNVLGNMIMFLPYGFFASYFLNIKKTSIIFILSLIASLTIEYTQLMIGRVFDIDDIVLNVIGGVVGFLIYKLIFSIKNKLPSFLKNKVIYNIIVLVLIILLILYLWKFLRVGVLV